MFRALVWKEWRQHRALRWAGAALGVVLPVAFLAGARAASMGLLPLGRVEGDATRTIVLDLLPATLALGLWPLAALLAASQAFVGDRAAGLESFLLERPVARSKVWVARLTGAVVTTALTIAVTFLIWVALAWALTEPGSSRWSDPAGMMAAGAAVTAIALCSATAAATLLASPLAAVLLGLILGAVPFGLALLLGSGFPLAGYRGVSIGIALPWLLVPGFLLTSYLTACRGEPAGRGRMVRWSVASATGLIVVLVLFLAIAPIAIRADAMRFDRGVQFLPSPSGVAAIVAPSNGLGVQSGWIVGLGDGKRRAFLRPPVWDAEWTEDGKWVAVVSDGGALGHVREDPTLEILDANGRPAGAPIRAAGLLGPLSGMRWAQGSLVAAVARADKYDLMLVDPRSGRTRTVKIGRKFWEFSFAGPTRDGRLFLALGKSAGADVRSDTEYGVFRVDIERGRIESEPLLRDTGRPWTAGVRLSPSGRYWMRDGDAQEGESRRVLDVASGAEVLPAVPRGAGARWLADDRLVWLESDGGRSWLMLASPGLDPEVLRLWERGGLSVKVSPDGKRLLVLVTGEGPAGPAHRVMEAPSVPPERKGTCPGASVFEIATGQWTNVEIEPPFEASWAGPDTVGFASGGRVHFARGTSTFPLE